MFEAQTRSVILFSDFSKAQLNSLTWYDYLPGDPIWIENECDPRTASAIANFLMVNSIEKNEFLLDVLAAKLLNLCPSIDKFKFWSELSYKLSETMAANLTSSGSRSLRMKAQRCIYYLQSIIDSSLENSSGENILFEIKLDGQKPWDYLVSSFGEWWISSGNENIHHRMTDKNKICFSKRLPTQIDLLSDGTITFGSIYTNGLSSYNGTWDTFNHDKPVLLRFEFDSKEYFLDHKSSLFESGSRDLVLQVPRPQVHFARFFDGILYIMDNMDFGCITLVDMKSLSIKRQNILPVQVCNDITVTPDGLYLIDKQQGSIFKFGYDWTFSKRLLTFGRNKGQLIDPVSIRFVDGYLFVVSWLSAKLTKLKTF